MSHLHECPTMRYFQCFFRCADGVNRLGSSIAMLDHPGLKAVDCLRHTTQFVRDNLISIWEVAS